MGRYRAGVGGYVRNENGVPAAHIQVTPTRKTSAVIVDTPHGSTIMTSRRAER